MATLQAAALALSVAVLSPGAVALAAAEAASESRATATSDPVAAAEPGGESAGETGDAGEEIAAPTRTLRDWYDMGGWVMHGLVACSVLALAIVLERLWGLRRAAVAPGRLSQALRECWNPAALDGARAACNGSGSSLARLVRVGVGAIERGSAHPLEHVASAGDAEALHLRRNLALLAALANIATMLGLLGTVLGMIEAFDLISITGTGDARVVARGIFQALVTTAAGLGIGIATLLAHALLRRRVDARLLELEGLLNELFEAESESPDDGTSPTASELATAVR